MHFLGYYKAILAFRLQVLYSVCDLLHLTVGSLYKYMKKNQNIVVAVVVDIVYCFTLVHYASQGDSISQYVSPFYPHVTNILLSTQHMYSHITIFGVMILKKST